MLPAKVDRYMWNTLSPSLKFLKSLPCTNKPHGSRFVSHVILLPLIWMKQLQKKKFSIQQNTEVIKALGNHCYFSGTSQMLERYPQAEAPIQNILKMNSLTALL